MLKFEKGLKVACRLVVVEQKNTVCIKKHSCRRASKGFCCVV